MNKLFVLCISQTCQLVGIAGEYGSQKWLQRRTGTNHGRDEKRAQSDRHSAGTGFRKTLTSRCRHQQNHLWWRQSQDAKGLIAEKWTYRLALFEHDRFLRSDELITPTEWALTPASAELTSTVAVKVPRIQINAEAARTITGIRDSDMSFRIALNLYLRNL